MFESCPSQPGLWFQVLLVQPSQPPGARLISAWGPWLSGSGPCSWPSGFPATHNPQDPRP